MATVELKATAARGKKARQVVSLASVDAEHVGLRVEEYGGYGRRKGVTILKLTHGELEALVSGAAETDPSVVADPDPEPTLTETDLAPAVTAEAAAALIGTDETETLS